ncbi:ABC transporter ATP-binding protein [Lachnospiraceae bacterium ZAX-1]
MEQNKKIRLSVENLQISYGQIKAVENASFQVYEGEIVALIGSNGAGKSTLLNCIIGLLPPVSGKILFEGNNLFGLSSEKIVKQGIAMVPEGRGVLAQMSILENLQLGAYHYNGNFQENLERIYTRFPILKDREHQAAGTLSGGEQQQLVIGRALMSSPKLLLLDEPSLALAPVMVDKVFHTLKDLQKEGLTILLSEQNARKALQFSDRGYVIDLGDIALSGKSQDLLEDERVREAYLGGSAPK